MNGVRSDDMLEYFPEPEEKEPATKCDLCEKPLYQRDTFYKLLGKYICKDCIDFAESEVE